jgi:hypothetical protein
LCLVVSLHATMIELPPTVAEAPASEEAPPAIFQLNLSALMALAFTYTYGSFYDEDEQRNVTEAIQPAYQAFLDHLLGASGSLGPGIEVPTPPVDAMSLTVLESPLDGGADPFTTSIPEPGTWWLAAAGAAWLALRRSR